MKFAAVRLKKKKDGKFHSSCCAIFLTRRNDAVIKSAEQVTLCSYEGDNKKESFYFIYFAFDARETFVPRMQHVLSAIYMEVAY